ncbi:unnamed protein product [Mytilus edulis]|uniref:Reverse transcriptase domain-containing protein n=1 Tax=Mytilus edulis TaxID=6550 RepID=A0A8S3QY61_MYTED|nr:unnamed protein product [Mytilus edulis]
METPTKKTKTLSDLPWIGYCSQQHKQNILNNNYLCSDIIISTQNLLKFEFPEINGFQETTLAPVKLNGKWVSETGFQSQESPSLQIHHNGNAHWVLSLQTRDGNIYLLDSLSLNLTTSLEYQLTQIYGKDKKKLIIRIPDVQKQQNSIDCGLFAIANALEFCQTGFKGGTHITYEQKYMREHLIHCLENGKFTHFPKNNFGKTPKNLKTKTHIISINCDCGKPDTIEDMVGCEGKTGPWDLSYKSNFELEGGSRLLNSAHKEVNETMVNCVNGSVRYDESNDQTSGHLNLQVNVLTPVVECCVRINGQLTDWFNVQCGLKQGCLLSPLLFNVYVNGLVTYICSLNAGINIDEENVSILLYADDLVLLAGSESDLQVLLDGLQLWCAENKMTINHNKSNVVHFRPNSTPRTINSFKCGDLDINVVEKYTYLGLVLTEHLDYQIMAKHVAASANRALGLVISKYKSFGGLPFDSFTKLYDSIVWSTISYGAAVWGDRTFSCINSIQNKAIRFYMGVGRYTPNVAVNGDSAWKPPCVRQWRTVINHWNRLRYMNTDRLNKRIHNWAEHSFRRYKACKNSNYRLYQQFESCNISDWYNDTNIHKTTVLAKIEDKLLTDFKNKWTEDLHRVSARRMDGETKVKVLNSTNNRKRRIKKPWWNDKLTNKWNIVCTAERDYVTCKQGSLKQQLRKDFVDKRKDFDKLTQKYKRQYWYRCQEELVNFSDNDTNQFWRRIGQIGIGNERQMRIPNEVTLDDGTISNNLETVLSKWKNSFHSLLNPNVNADYNKVDNCILKENIICIDLDKEITIDEITSGIHLTQAYSDCLGTTRVWRAIS